MRARWNETTRAVLEVLVREDGSTVREISKEVDSEEGNISTILLRLYRAGHVSRERVEDGRVVIDQEEKVSRPRYIYEYSITERGRGRLSFISGDRSKGLRRIAANPKRKSRDA